MSLDLPASSSKSPNSEADLFASLRKTAPPPSRKPPPPPVIKQVAADASSELELEMDDILEVEEIGDFSNPSLEGTEPHAKPPVEALPPAPQPAPHAQIARPAHPTTLESPVMPKTLMGMPPAKVPEPAATAPVIPPAPNTSPLPLELEDLGDDRLAEKTMEIRKDAVAQAAEHLADEYEGIGHTEVMVRTPELANAKATTQKTTQKSPVHVQTPSQALSVTAPVSARMPAAQRPSWQPHPSGSPLPAPLSGQPMRRPSSIAPVAMDPSMPPVHSLPPQRGMSTGAIAGLVFGAVALIGLVGAGGFAASRALSKESTTAIADESPSSPGVSTTTVSSPAPLNTNNVSAPAAPAEETAPAPAVASNPAPSSAGVDVSALPSAPPKSVAAPASHPVSTPASSPASHPTTSTPSKSAKTAAPEKTPTPATQPAAAANTAKVDPNAPLPPPNAAAANAPLPPANAPLPAPAAAAPRSNVGTVHVDPNLRVVQIDGAFRRAQDGFVTVQCGPHRIKAGMSERTIDVPCGGAVNF